MFVVVDFSNPLFVYGMFTTLVEAQDWRDSQPQNAQLTCIRVGSPEARSFSQQSRMWGPEYR